jgi:hypothetical protein
MGEPQIQITPQDIIEAEEIDFEEKKEFWNEYKLKDGTTLKVRLILIGVKRLKKFAPDGNPVYIINSNNVVRVFDVPKELKHKAKEPSLKPV